MPKRARAKSNLRRLLIPGLLIALVGVVVAGWFVFFPSAKNITEADVLNLRFPRALKGGVPLFRPEVTSWKHLRDEITRLQVPFAALRQPKQLGSEPKRFKGDIFSLKFSTPGMIAQQTLFYRYTSKARNNCGILLIPGTGFDQATKISRGKGYHGDIAETIKPLCDLFVLVKPNQGPLAIHNGKNSLDYRVLRVTLLNEGFSYTVTYFAHAQAILQYMTGKYQRTGVVGLSQGGEASLLISNLENPDFAIVASGYSINNAVVEYKDLKQTIHPDHRSLNKPSIVRDAINRGKTNYLFSWGLAEKYDYGLEARTLKTCKYFKEAAPGKVTCISHGGKHVFPLNEVSAFIQQQTK